MGKGEGGREGERERERERERGGGGDPFRNPQRNCNDGKRLNSFLKKNGNYPPIQEKK